MKTTILPSMIGALIISLTVTFSAPAAPKEQPRQKLLSINEINTRMASLQVRADSLSALLEQLRQDSAKAVQETARQNSSQSRKLADIDDTLGKKRALAAAAKTEYDKARQDSAAIIAKNREQTAVFRKELQLAGLSLASLNNELALLIERQERISATSTGTDDKTLVKLQNQANQRDSLVRVRQADVANMSARRDKLRQDSLQAETKRAAEAEQFHQQTVRLDSMIASCDAVIARIEQKQTGAKAEKEQKTAQLQQSISLFTKQKQAAEEQSVRLNAELATLTAERNRIEQSSNSTLLKYEEARLPYETALTKAETEQQQAMKDKTVLIALRDKFSIDSSIMKARDVLDQAIQAEAARKKGAKKLVEQRENELDLLLQRQDSVTRATPGLRQRESQFRASTNSQKTALVDSAISQNDRKIASAAANRDKLKQSLAAFDQKYPRPKSTATERSIIIDSSIATKKRAAIQQTGISDSLNILLQEHQAALTGISSKGKGEAVDSTLISKKNDKAAHTAKLTKVQRDSAQNDAAAATSVLKIKTEISSAGSQILIAQNEAAAFAAERDKIRQTILSTQEKNLQSQASMAADMKKTDSLAAAKQEEISRLSMKLEKTRKDSTAAATQADEQMRAISPSPASLADLVATVDREILALRKQRDSISRASLAGTAGSDAEKKISLQIAAINRSIESAKSENTALASQKEEASLRLKADKLLYDSLQGAAEQEVADAVARRDRARQDSITAENNARQSSGKVSSIVKQQDSSIAFRQKELSDLTADYNRMVENNKGTSEKTPASLQVFSQSLKTIDEQIAVKEGEIADLRAKKDKVKQDSIAESKHQAGLIASARAETAKFSAVVEQKKIEVSLAMAEKRKVLADTGSFQKKSMDAVAAAATEIRRLNDRIEKGRTEIARIQQEREKVSANIKAASEKSSGSVVVTDEPARQQPSATAPSAPPLSVTELAQKKTDEIYALLGENKIAEAAKKFRALQQFFKMNLDADSFLALKTTIEQMGGSVK